MTPSPGRDALVERLFTATIGALELFSIHVGSRLGLYEILGAGDLVSSEELAARAGIAPRYAREWCEQQAVAGFLTAEGDTADTRRFRLDPEYVPVFTDREDPSHVVPFAPMIAGVAQTLPRVVEAYKSGQGVDYRHYGRDFRDGQGGINRPAFTAEMASWLASSPEIAARLEGDPPARVADVGCGQGYSTVAIAKAYARVRVEGYDLDGPSIEDATRLAEESGLDDRVTFSTRDVSDLDRDRAFDLVTIFEAVHDMSRPVEVLSALRDHLVPDGSLLIADERVADEFTAPGDEVERVMYGWSVVHCLPVAMAEQPSAALGTVLRRSTVEALARDAGFATVEVLPIENDFFRFYRLTG